MHPTVIIQAFRQALEDAVAILGDEVGVPVDMDDEAQLVKVVQSSIGTKFISRWANLAAKIAIDANGGAGGLTFTTLQNSNATDTFVVQDQVTSVVW